METKLTTKLKEYIDNERCLNLANCGETSPACLCCHSNQMFADSLNTYGEGEDAVTLSSLFWDCECDVNYIHHVSEDRCEFCETYREDSPESRLEEIYEEW